MTNELHRIEHELGFRFGDPDGEAEGHRAPTIALICRNPDCTMTGQHVAVHHDTVQPVTCGGILTDPDGTTHPCGSVLRCDHQTVTAEHTEGTFGAPVRITTTKCLKCGTITATDREALPPVNIADIPLSVLDATTSAGGALPTS